MMWHGIPIYPTMPILAGFGGMLALVSFLALIGVFRGLNLKGDPDARRRQVGVMLSFRYPKRRNPHKGVHTRHFTQHEDGEVAIGDLCSDGPSRTAEAAASGED